MEASILNSLLDFGTVWYFLLSRLSLSTAISMLYESNSAKLLTNRFVCRLVCRLVCEFSLNPMVRENFQTLLSLRTNKLEMYAPFNFRTLELRCLIFHL